MEEGNKNDGDREKEVWSGKKRSFASGWLKFIGSIINR